MKHSVLLTWFIVLAVLLNTPVSVHATLVGTCTGSETQYLCHFFNQAKHKIDIRCAFLDDSLLLKALQQAGKRGVKIRLVVDILTRSLLHLTAQSSGRIIVHLLPPSENGRYLAHPITHIDLRYARKRGIALTLQGKRFLAEANPEAFAEVDYIQSWYGVPCWTSAAWVGICTTVIHTLNPDPKDGSSRFMQGWQHSHSASTDVATLQGNFSPYSKRGRR